MAKSENSRRVGRLMIALGALWIVASFLTAGGLLEVQGLRFTPWLGFILLFLGRGINRSGRRRPMETASDMSERPLNTDRSRPQPTPPRRPAPPPAPTVLPTEPTIPEVEERSELLEKILGAATDEAETRDVLVDPEDFHPVTSAEMIARAREKYNRDR